MMGPPPRYTPALWLGSMPPPPAAPSHICWSLLHVQCRYLPPSLLPGTPPSPAPPLGRLWYDTPAPLPPSSLLRGADPHRGPYLMPEAACAPPVFPHPPPQYLVTKHIPPSFWTWYPPTHTL
ncbi:lysophosphatidic acid receptor 1 [Platysternon megacephalum]|uniref:Lysophosphatidic acid receptor 1 n=1 Tax=Platysternon megacephalum TaxID=55544 RepID=A0A4D9EJB2_9SAUR|nr:lysophosphatidic acid receptor 1 [Platysternon megacephalum]